MSEKKSAKIQDHFATLTDPRRRPPVYPLINIVTIAVCAVICGADDFVAIEKFGKSRRKWFARILDLKDGIPSHDRFNAIFAALDPAEFEQCLISWITALHEITATISSCSRLASETPCSSPMPCCPIPAGHFPTNFGMSVSERTTCTSSTTVGPA